MTENGAVNGDKISMTSTKAATWPIALQRTVMGVRSPIVPSTLGHTRSAPQLGWRLSMKMA
jgi:hypothetical protein